MRTTVRFIFIEAACCLFIALFVYAALAKLLEFDNFRAQLGQSPLLSAYTGFISVAVPGLELAIAGLLAVRRFKYAAMFGAFVMMVLFTAYIAMILNYSSYVPCSCGGILEKMGWREHLVFNVCFTVLSGMTLVMLCKRPGVKKTLLAMAGACVAGTTLIVALFVASERAMHYENPFIRRFVQGTATRVGETDIKSTSLYFAGADHGLIYLGDNLAPLHILVYDSLMHYKTHYKISLDREDFPFRSVQVRIAPPYFYVTDGTVPVVYRGNVSDWKANVVMDSHYFSRVEILDGNRMAFRSASEKTHENVLGIFDLSGKPAVTYAPGLLQRQIDGFFDTDGTMHYDPISKRLAYVYYYRNEYLIADSRLKLLYRGHTIDTTAHANIRVAYLNGGRDSKLASVPPTVNQLSFLRGDLLFVNSKLMGRYEPRDMWRRASAVDVYDIAKHAYLSSFYVYNADKSPVQDLLATPTDFYTITGHYLHHYRLGKYLRAQRKSY